MDRKQIDEMLTKLENGEEVNIQADKTISKKETQKNNEDKSSEIKKENQDKVENLTSKEKEETEEKFADLKDTVIKTNGKPLEECSSPLLPCANDLRLSVKKYTGEYIIDEDCCTAITLLLKNDGNIATSFMGAHNVMIVKTLEKSLKQYFKAIKKTLKAEQKKKTTEDEIKVIKEDKENNEKENIEKK